MSTGCIVLSIGASSLALLIIAVVVSIRRYDNARSSFVDFKHKCGQ